MWCGGGAAGAAKNSRTLKVYLKVNSCIFKPGVYVYIFGHLNAFYQRS